MTQSDSADVVTQHGAPEHRVPRPVVHLLAWCGIALVHAIITLVDAARRGTQVGVADLLISYLLAYVPWALLSWNLAARFARHADAHRGFRGLATLFGVLFLCFFLPQVVYQAALTALLNGQALASVPARLRATPVLAHVLDAVLFVATFAVVSAIAAARARREEEVRRQQLDAENAALRTEAARQQLQLLQAQLEPHFLFNALNAIGSTVRTGDRSQALEAIQQLASLLRAAVHASTHARISWAAELAFTRDYLGLQQLRYGARMQHEVLADTEALEELSCIPMVLQPLVENAVRHALERVSAPVRIVVTVDVGATGVQATVTNPLFAHAEPNPGLGQGLVTLRRRLALAYGGDATLDVSTDHDHYTVRLHVPLDHHD